MAEVSWQRLSTLAVATTLAAGGLLALDQPAADAHTAHPHPARGHQRHRAPHVAHHRTHLPMLAFGSTGRTVETVQRRLRIGVDGVFGPQTRAAVKAFQRAHRLEVDGVVGRHTWARLRPAHATTLRAVRRLPWLEKGDRGPAVAAAQRLLGVGADGDFGPVTHHAVLRFQHVHHLERDGVIGPHTWAALRGLPDRAASRWARRAPLVDRAATVIAYAAEQEGKPYVYGGAGPQVFDCSGLVRYVFAHFGIDLPHNAQMQYDAVRHVPKSDLRVGDIVFLPNSRGHIVHDGIYAGDGYWWVARHTGTTVTRQHMYTDDFVVGRVLG